MLCYSVVGKYILAESTGCFVKNSSLITIEV